MDAIAGLGRSHWAERAGERIAESESGEVPTTTESSPGGSAARSETGCQAEEASEAESGAEPYRRGHRQTFPASWPRVPRHIRVEGSQRICQVCGKEKRCHVQSELLAIRPAEIYVLQTQREKLVCPDEHEGVVTAPAVPRRVEQSACDLSMSLDLLGRKLVQHQPIYRVQQVYARLGASVAEATLDRCYANALDSLCIIARCIRAATTNG